MNKKIILSLASVACLASCGGGEQPTPTKDLTPVSESVGMERAEKIYVEQSKANNAFSSHDYETIFSVVPKNFAVDSITVENGKKREIFKSGGSYYGNEEIVYNNVITETMHVDFDFENLFYHVYMAENDPEDGVMNMNMYCMYDTEKSIFYYLIDTNGFKIKIMEIPCSSDDGTKYLIDIARNYISTYVLNDLYLYNITYKDDEKGYYLLNQYKNVQEKLGAKKDDKQFFTYQFGSDDEESLSIRNDANYYYVYQEENLRMEGYWRGMEGIEYDFTFPAFISSAPNLVVFKNNIVNYAEFNNTMDIVSQEAPGLAKGAAYINMSRKTTLEVNKDAAEINKPNPDDYISINI